MRRIEHEQIEIAVRPTEQADRSAEEMQADLALLQQGKSVKQKRVNERRLALTKRVGLSAVVLAALVLTPYGLLYFGLTSALGLEESRAVVGRFMRVLRLRKP